MPVLVLALSCAILPVGGGERPFEIAVETGPVWQTKNDVQIPNDATADRFSLVDLVGGGPWVAARAEFLWDFRARHGLRLLAAPLEITERGTLDESVRFAGETFDTESGVEATYQFHSWRATYRYRLSDGPRWKWWIGATLKVRDARIRLEQGDTVGEDTDLGLVPLLYLRGEGRLSEHWSVVLDFDGLAGGPGRAFDVSAQVRRRLGERWVVGGGYRTVEGGADVDEVYNFAWFHSAVASAAVRF